MANLGIPEITQPFLANQDLFYTQFNEIEFFVEDVHQENLYLRILKKFFPEVKIGKIFPLGGKPFVIEAAINSLGDRKKVYIVDLDFDEIFNLKVDIENLFYLDAYSIENYLLEEEAVIEFIKEQNPKIKNEDILKTFNFQSFKLECINLFSDIVKSYLVVQFYNLGIPNVTLGPQYFYNLSNIEPTFNTATWVKHCDLINIKLQELNQTYELASKLSDYDKYFANEDLAIKNIPGKYLLRVLKHRIELLLNR